MYVFVSQRDVFRAGRQSNLVLSLFVSCRSRKLCDASGVVGISRDFTFCLWLSVSPDCRP